MNNNKKDKTLPYKIILIGDCKVGKTSFLHEFIIKDKKTNKNHPPTIGVQYATTVFRSKNLNKQVKTQVWDTSGAEKYQAITSSYYRNSQGAAMIFDITERSTFNNIVKWLQNIKKYTKKNMAIVLVANKIDLVEKGEKERKISQSQLTSFCVEHHLTFKQTSAITGYNVGQVFEQILQKIDQNNAEPDISNVNITITSEQTITMYRQPIPLKKNEEADVNCPKCC